MLTVNFYLQNFLSSFYFYSFFFFTSFREMIIMVESSSTFLDKNFEH